MWDRLKKTAKPIVLYGTGNAAEKIIAELNKRNITIAGIFASDGFVRSRTFAGYPVLSYADIKAVYGDMIVLLCFGSHLPDVLNNIIRINSEQELYAPDLPIAGNELFTAEYKNRHIDEITYTEALLADDQSRKVFRNVIDYKLSGKISYLLDAETPEDENWKLLNIGINEIFLDLGAYTGDTVGKFLTFADSKYNKIIAVEPEKRNFRKLTDNSDGLHDIELINKAVGDHCGEVIFEKSTGRGGAIGKGKGIAAELTTVDELLDGNAVSIIKMDLEGQEPYAIKGAEKTIVKYRPRMLVSAYHRSDDLWEIPKLVLGINPDYKIYLRKDPCLPAWEVNYYFV